MAPSIAKLGFMRLKLRRSVIFLPCSATSTKHALANWLITVAIAAPATPISNANMNSGSSAILSTAPMSTESMAVMLLPCAVRKVFMPVAICTKSVPMR